MAKKTDQLLGISDRAKVTSEFELAIEEIRRNGYSVIEGVLTGSDLEILHAGALERIYDVQCEEIGGEDVMLEIGEDGSVKHLYSYDPFFIGLLKKEVPLSLTKHFLGDKFSLYLQNAIMNYPTVENPASVWHRDLPYQHYVSDRPLSITTLYVIDEFSPETGGTWVLPGSHTNSDFPSEVYVNKHKRQLSAPAGSAIVFDSMLYHQAGFNQSNNIRRSIGQTFTVPIIRPQMNSPALLAGEYSDDPFLRMIFSYDYTSADSALAYRQKRLPMGSERVDPGAGKRLANIGE
jgi:ectoine hydroxylase-related dioxygenase (phytanoyl-CoA dioxygenase family)